ncbi:hypothetical protein ACFQ6B_02850 [Streptomyces wedmorensis]|uniref:Integral-membrane protein n=1 Tax=Streptomyces wedmorensis TaxID=43759 RepID=A0ABW6IYY7_STRWE
MSAHHLPASTLLAAFAATTALAWAAAGRRRSTPTIAGALLVLQSALHLTFSTTGAHPATRPTDAPPGGLPHAHAMAGMEHAHAMAGMEHAHAMPGMEHAHAMAAMTTDHTASSAASAAATSAAAMSATSETATAHPASGAGMLAVHLLAALLCGLWLAHGEAAFFTLARTALAYAFTPLRLLFARVRVPDAPRRPIRGRRRNARRPHAVVLAHTLSRRGPPRLSAPRATALGAHV